MKIWKKLMPLWLASIVGFGFGSTPASAGSDPLIGELMLFGGSFCPRGWAPAAGQLVAINTNTALFSIFGTMYGGDGRTTFGLPDLRGRAPISTGQGPGLANFRQGQKAGGTVSLTVANLPAHSHTLEANNQAANKGGPGGNYFSGSGQTGVNSIYTTVDPNRTMGSKTIGNTGSNAPISVMGPSLAIQWCVALEGIYPSRS